MYVRRLELALQRAPRADGGKHLIDPMRLSQEPCQVNKTPDSAQPLS
jgi:hypothetical protein